MVLTEQELAHASPLARVFVPALRARFPNEAHSERVEGSDVRIEFPARAPEVGSLGLLVDSEEVTIQLGQHTHLHISPWTYGDKSTDPLTVVTEAALEYIQNVFSDQVVIWSQHVNGRQTSGGAYHRTRATGPTWRPDGVAAYLWSGARHLPSDRRDA